MPSFPPILSPAFLASLVSHPSLPKDTWYFIAATTLSVINRSDEIPKVYRYALDHGSSEADSPLEHDERLKISRRMREALIKASAIGGVPRSINALLALKDVTPEELQDEPLTDSPTSRRKEMYEASSSQILERGQIYFEKVYGKVSKRVMGQMDRSGTEDLGLTARLMYGYILSNTNVLNPAETSFVMIAGLIPMDVNPQLKGHLRGALNGGARIEEIRAVREVVIQICEASGMKAIGNDVPAGWGWRGEIEKI